MDNLGVETTGDEIVQKFGDHGEGKTIVITGPSQGGIGAEIATTIAKAMPAKIMLLGRSNAKIAPVAKQISQISPKTELSVVHCDLCDNDSVSTAAREVNFAADSIDVLINNAGVMAVRSFQRSRNDVELQFAAGYLGHFLLTNLLQTKIVAARGVVINITSSAYTLAEVNTEDPNFEDGKTYNPWVAYGRTKTANILFSHALMQKFGAKGLSSFAVDPGMVTGTNLMSNSGVDGELMQEGMAMAVARNDGKELPPHATVNLQQGCATAVLAALDPALKDKAPAFVKECAIVPTLPYAHSQEIAMRLWSLSEKLVNAKFS